MIKRFRTRTMVLLSISISIPLLLIWMKNANYHYQNEIIPQLLFGVLFLTVLLLILSIKDVGIKIGVLLAGIIVFGVIGFIIIMVGGWEIKEMHYKNRKEPIVYESYSSGRWLLITGQSYFGKLVYRYDHEEVVSIESPDYPYDLINKYQLPKELDDSTAVIVWKHEKLILDLVNEVAYPAIPKSKE